MVEVSRRPSSYRSEEDKIAKIYGYPEEASEFKGVIELHDNELAFREMGGIQIFGIPYNKIIKCYMDFPGDLESRSMRRLAIVPGWWKLAIPMLAKRHYLKILIREHDAERLLNFIFSDRVYSYLKEMCETINSKITPQN